MVSTTVVAGYYYDGWVWPAGLKLEITGHLRVFNNFPLKWTSVPRWYSPIFYRSVYRPMLVASYLAGRLILNTSIISDLLTLCDWLDYRWCVSVYKKYSTTIIFWGIS